MSSNDKTDTQKLLKALPDNSPYEVGYGKPPKHNQFKAGVSGNPKGRPKGSKNKSPAPQVERYKSIILDEAYRTIKINENGNQVFVSMIEATTRSLAVKAVKGDTRAQKLFSELVTASEASNKQQHVEKLETAILYKDSWSKEIDRCKKASVDIPKPIPHSDHIEIDWITGDVTFSGPITQKQKDELDFAIEQKASFGGELVFLNDELIENTQGEYHDTLKEDIAYVNCALKNIERVMVC